MIEANRSLSDIVRVIPQLCGQQASAQGVSLGYTLRQGCCPDTLEAVLVDTAAKVQARFLARMQAASAFALHDLCELLANGGAALDSMNSLVPRHWRMVSQDYYPQHLSLYRDRENQGWHMLHVQPYTSSFSEQRLTSFNVYLHDAALAQKLANLVRQGSLFCLAPQPDFEFA